MFNNIRIEKGLYNITGKTFTQALTDLDPDEAYIGTNVEGLDAFERQLKRFDIKVKGESCDRVEKFFTTTETAVLFPEFVRRTIKAGLEEASILGSVVCAKSYTDGIDYRGLTVESTGTTAGVNEAGEVPVTTVRLSSSASRLTKYARRLSCSFESIRKQRIESFAVILKNLGGDISRAINKAACEALANGVSQGTINGDVMTYGELSDFWGSMTAHDMTTIITTPSAVANLVALDEMKYVNNNDRIKTPFGVEIVKCGNLDSNIAIGIDKLSALEMIYGSDVEVNFDKLISTQCDEISASIIVGFSKLSDDAVKVIKTASN